MSIQKLYEDVLDDIENITPALFSPEPEDDKYPILREDYAYSIIVNRPIALRDEWKSVPGILRGYLDAYADSYRIAEVSSDGDNEELRREAAPAVVEPCVVVQFNVRKVFLCRLLFLILSVGVSFYQAIRMTSGGQTRYFIQGPFITDAHDIVRKDYVIGDERIWELATDIAIMAVNMKYFEIGNVEDHPEWTEANKVVKSACRMAAARKALRGK